MAFRHVVNAALGTTANYYKDAGRHGLRPPSSWLRAKAERIEAAHLEAQDAHLTVYRMNTVAELMRMSASILEEKDIRDFDKVLMSWAYETAARVVAGNGSTLYPKPIEPRPVRSDTSKWMRAAHLAVMAAAMFAIGVVVWHTAGN